MLSRGLPGGLVLNTQGAAGTRHARSYYDPQIPLDEYGVKEEEQIGWLAAAMQRQNSEMPAVMEEAVRKRRGKGLVFG